MGKKELREGGREIKEGRKNRVKENWKYAGLLLSNIVVCIEFLSWNTSYKHVQVSVCGKYCAVFFFV
jgi:hypothetical protein